jgi:transposase
MNKVREIIRLKEQCNLSERAISRALNLSRPVVAQYLRDIGSSGLSYSEIELMDDDSLTEMLAGRNSSKPERYIQLTKLFDYFVKELKRTGVTLQCLWQEYRAEHPDGYSYTQFCYHFQVWRSSSELTMHLDHKAGDKMFADFTGKKLTFVDKQSGAVKEVEVFVAILPASQLTYVEATESQRKHDWIMANQNAFHYFGGVPQAVVPDNLKSAVNTPNFYEPEINPEYFDFARHYQTVILPARPNHARDKAMVEGAVKIVYAWIFAALRDRIFYSLKELNLAIAEQLESYNAKPMQKLKISRRELFEQTEKATLKTLPQQKYARKHFKQLKVQFNYHVQLREDMHYYSVPYRYRGKHVLVIYTESVVEIFYNNLRIAFHQRDRTPNDYSTVKEHMPSHHQAYSDWNPQRLINWAEQLGEHVKAVVEYILAHRQHPEQGYRVCLGILSLAKRYNKERLNKACQKAVYYQHYSLKGIENILKNRLEDYQQESLPLLPSHSNIRGTQYYQKQKEISHDQ